MKTIKELQQMNKDEIRAYIIELWRVGKTNHVLQTFNNDDRNTQLDYNDIFHTLVYHYSTPNELKNAMLNLGDDTLTYELMCNKLLQTMSNKLN